MPTTDATSSRQHPVGVLSNSPGTDLEQELCDTPIALETSTTCATSGARAASKASKQSSAKLASSGCGSCPLNASLPIAWKKQMVDSVINDIKRAEFVALDLEFSGLFKTSAHHHVFQHYFKDCVESVEQFMVVQLGVCPVWRSSTHGHEQSAETDGDQSDVWHLAPYNFHVFPSSRQIFSADSSTFSWLLDNGFSFRDWIQKGFDYARMALLQNLSLYTSSSRFISNVQQAAEEGLQRIISTIVDYEKPIVVHNGLLDILHIHDKFIDTLPVFATEFCSEWMRIFSGGVYDTKHIATSGKYSVMQLASDSGTILAPLFTHLRKLNLCRSHMCLAPRYFTLELPGRGPNASTEAGPPSSQLSLMTGDYQFDLPDSTSTSTGKSRLHEAGYDAFITAQVFLMENELYHTAPLRKSPGQAPRDASQTELIPMNWKVSEVFGTRFRDILELTKISPGKIDLKSIAQAYQQGSAPDGSSSQPDAAQCGEVPLTKKRKLTFPDPSTQQGGKAHRREQLQYTADDQRRVTSLVERLSGALEPDTQTAKLLLKPASSREPDPSICSSRDTLSPSETAVACRVSHTALTTQRTDATTRQACEKRSQQTSSVADQRSHCPNGNLKRETGLSDATCPTTPCLPSATWAVPLRQYMGVAPRSVSPAWRPAYQQPLRTAHPAHRPFRTLRPPSSVTAFGQRPVFPNQKLDLTKPNS